jgi:lysophospholipase L1-like esterase
MEGIEYSRGAAAMAVASPRHGRDGAEKEDNSKVKLVATGASRIEHRQSSKDDSKTGTQVTPAFRILCYGDSLTAGFYDRGENFCPYGEVIQKTLTSLGYDCEVHSCGLSGHPASQMVAELDIPYCMDVCGMTGSGLAFLLDNHGRFDLVIIMAGTNDYKKDFKDQYIKNLVVKLHEACHSRGVPTAALGAPCNIQNQRLRFSQQLRDWANRQNMVRCFVDPEDVIPRSEPAYWEPDKVHFSPTGSCALGKHLGYVFAKILAEMEGMPPLVSLNKAKQSQSQKLTQTATAIHQPSLSAHSADREHVYDQLSWLRDRKGPTTLSTYPQKQIIGPRIPATHGGASSFPMRSACLPRMQSGRDVQLERPIHRMRLSAMAV